MPRPVDKPQVTPARRSLICPYGHDKKITRYCHECKRLAAQKRYEMDPEAPEKKRAQRLDKKYGTKKPKKKSAPTTSQQMPNERKMMLLTNAPNTDCTHALAYEVGNKRVHCYGCDAEWPLGEESAAVPPVAKKRGRPPKARVGTMQTELPIDNTEAVRDPELFDSGDGDSESESEIEMPVPQAPAIAGSVSKTSRRGKKATEAPEISEGAEYEDVGPWHDNLKCPNTGCFTKLQHHAPNIVNNGQKTFHYGCPSCDEVRVVVHIGSIK